MSLPNIVIISGVGIRDFNGLEEIWTVVGSENLFFEINFESTLFRKFLFC